MARRLVITAHWSDAGGPEDVERACVAMAPLKEVGTKGWAAAWGEKDGADLLAILQDKTHEDLQPEAATVVQPTPQDAPKPACANCGLESHDTPEQIAACKKALGDTPRRDA